MERFGPSTQLDEAEYRTEPVQPIAEQVESGRQAASRTVRMGPGNFPENPERASLQPKPRVHAAPQIDVDKYYVIDSSKIKSTGTDEDDANVWFNIITKLQKSGGDMFLFGIITEKIFEIVVRIYHENLSRLVHVKEPPAFMLGILEDHNGNIYMAISEDPEEDPKFIPKIKSLYQMLINANINVEIEENKVRGYVNGSDTDNYRSPRDPAYGDKISQLKGKSMFVINDNDYEHIDPIKVFLINSEKYLAERKKGWAYPPAKKLKKNGRTLYHECNNGSTCVEAKLFSYFYDRNPENKFENIRGFASYWVEKKLPPEHYMPKYSYCLPDDKKHKACLTTDYAKLTQMTSDILKQAGVNIKPETPEFDKYKIIWQPLALSCPGCLLNWSNYKNNRMHKFNYKTCAPKRLDFEQMIYYDPTIRYTIPNRSIAGGLKKRLNVKKVKTQRRKQQSNKRRKTRSKTNTLRIRNKINYKTKKSNNI